jgi:hypothetical protein
MGSKPSKPPEMVVQDHGRGHRPIFKVGLSQLHYVEPVATPAPLPRLVEGETPDGSPTPSTTVSTTITERLQRGGYYFRPNIDAVMAAPGMVDPVATTAAMTYVVAPPNHHKHSNRIYFVQRPTQSAMSNVDDGCDVLYRWVGHWRCPFALCLISYICICVYAADAQ